MTRIQAYPPGMSPAPMSRTPDPQGLHVATIAHEGLLWDTYLEFDNDPRRPANYRGRLRFDVAGSVGDGPARSAQTTVIIVEDSYEEAVAKARRMDERVLEALLRSALPEQA